MRRLFAYVPHYLLFALVAGPLCVLVTATVGNVAGAFFFGITFAVTGGLSFIEFIWGDDDDDPDDDDDDDEDPDPDPDGGSSLEIPGHPETLRMVMDLSHWDREMSEWMNQEAK